VLAERSGFARTYISDIECGKSSALPVDTLYVIARALDTDLTRMLKNLVAEGEEDEELPEPAVDAETALIQGLPASDRHLIRQALELSSDAREHLVRILRAITRWAIDAYARKH